MRDETFLMTVVMLCVRVTEVCTSETFTFG